MEACLRMGRKHCGIRRKCRSAFSPFPTMFSKGFFYRVIESHDCAVKGYISLTKQFLALTNVRKKPFENIVGEGENDNYQLFSLFQKRFCILCVSNQI